MPPQSKIYGGQRLQKAHAASAVTETVVRLQGDTAAVVVYSDKIAAITFKVHRHTGVFDIFLHEGTGSVVRLQITPEQPFSDRHFVGGEAGSVRSRACCKSAGSIGSFSFTLRRYTEEKSRLCRVG